MRFHSGRPELQDLAYAKEAAEEPEQEIDADDESEMLRERLELLKKLHQDLEE